jgi:hypothetical protein
VLATGGNETAATWAAATFVRGIYRVIGGGRVLVWVGVFAVRLKRRDCWHKCFYRLGLPTPAPERMFLTVKTTRMVDFS